MKIEWGVLCTLVVLSCVLLFGCALRLGPGENGWIGVDIWESASLEANVAGWEVCIGCRVDEAAEDEESDEEEEL